MAKNSKKAKKKSKNKKNGHNNKSNKGKHEVPSNDVQSSSSDADSSGSQEKPHTFVVPKLNTIIVGNLPNKADDTQVRNHFHQVGKIEKVLLDQFEDGSCRGTAQVEFTTANEVEEACKLNGSNFHGRAITVNFGHERRIITSGSSSFKRPPQYSANTVLIRGFDPAYDVEKMRPLLLEHFEGCGIIKDSAMFTDVETGASAGAMLLAFRDRRSLSKALLLNESKIGVWCLHVEQAQP